MSNIVPQNWQASTYLNSTIQTYADLAYRVKTHFGYPISVIELTDEMIANFIDDAIEIFTRYAGYTEEYLIFCDDLYISGCGVKLDEIGQIRCNLQQCVISSEEVYVSAVEITEEILDISAGLMSVTPFLYAPEYDKCDPSALKVSVATGQNVEIRFNPDEPWDITTVCHANCIRIKPRNSKCSELIANENLNINLNLEFMISENPDLYLSWVEMLSGYAYPMDNFPLTALPCDVLDYVPLSTFDLSAFYPDNLLIGEETTACVNIKDGKGFIYPKCNTADIDSCAPLSAQWYNNDISLEDATHFVSNNLPVCMGESIALDSFNGILGTFTLCNTAINTFGSFPIKNVQFLVDYKPPQEVLYQTFCDINNGGFILRYTNTDHDLCIPATSDFVDVDVEFLNVTTTDITALRVVETSSFYDESLQDRRKIHGVFSADSGNALGYSGYGANNILFNFDYAMVGSLFGYDMRGGRPGFYNNGYDLVGFHAAHAFMETTRKMLRYVSYTFNPDTQMLKITPEPKQGRFGNTYVDNPCQRQCYMVGAYVEKPVEHIIKEKWIQEWVIACMSETIGLIRSQYGTVTLYGGATVSGESLVTMGQTQKEKLLDQLRKENYYSAPPLFFLG